MNMSALGSYICQAYSHLRDFKCFYLQIYHFVPSSRVLVCTPSNSAADLICIRLHHSGFLHAASLARVNASYRHDEVLHIAMDKKVNMQFL